MHRPKWGGVLFLLFLATACRSDHAEKGDVLARQHRWTEALAEYRAALERYPRDYAAAWGIARIYCFGPRNPEKCVAWADKLVEIYPDHTDYRRAAATGWQAVADEAQARGDAAAAEHARIQAARYSVSSGASVEAAPSGTSDHSKR